MYISNLKLWNFRKFGSNEIFSLNNPDLEVSLNKGLNILIGENDSGKTTILDSIKLVLKTHAYEWIKIEESDFNLSNKPLRIEIEFSGITDNEAANFIEWCGWKDEEKIEDENSIIELRPKLILIYQAELRDGKIIPGEVRAGMDGYGNLLTAEAKEFLKCTYLKALRDADSELTAKKNSRLSQILKEHKNFKYNTLGEEHEFENIFKSATENIRDKFKDNQSRYYSDIKEVIDSFTKSFIDENKLSKFDLGDSKLSSILEKISLGIEGHKNLGLGTMNRLFMAAELLHLKKEYNGLKLCMIEELEAHLHPQSQLKIINRLKEEKEIQYILTTHSPNITSQADLKDIIVCKNNNVFPLGENYTKLDSKNYIYLKRFLDVTKSNLFFSKGNIIVEGWSEEIILPVLAKKLGHDLTKSEISIINVASIAYLHFAKIFMRKDNKDMKVPVSIITDLDNRPDENGDFNSLFYCTKEFKTKIINIAQYRRSIKNTKIKFFIAKEWTLEWCLYNSCLGELFKNSISEVHSGTNEFKKNDENFKPEFKVKFIQKLAKTQGTTVIDKVAVANFFAEKLEKDNVILKEQIEEDCYLKYLVDAIKHVVNEN